MFKCQDRESEGSEVTVKKRREGEEREEKVNKVKVPSPDRSCSRGAQDTETEMIGRKAQAEGKGFSLTFVLI